MILHTPFHLSCNELVCWEPRQSVGIPVTFSFSVLNNKDNYTVGVLGSIGSMLHRYLSSGIAIARPGGPVRLYHKRPA